MSILVLDGESTFHDCTQQQCDAVRGQINNTCKNNGWPVGHKVLLCDVETGKCCYCLCNGYPPKDD